MTTHKDSYTEDREKLADEIWNLCHYAQKHGATEGCRDMVRRLVDRHIGPNGKPPKGLLVSIALRLDHGLFAPFDGMVDPVQRGRHIQVALDDARRAWEECNGKGFWSPERNAEYEAMLNASPFATSGD